MERNAPFLLSENCWLKWLPRILILTVQHSSSSPSSSSYSLSLSFFSTVRSVDFWLFLADLNNDGNINEDEFKMMVKTGTYSQLLNGKSWEDDLRLMIFRVFDIDKDGVITLEEFRQGLHRLNASLPAEYRYRESDAQEAQKAFKELDKDGSEDLSVEEWTQCLLARTLITSGRIHPLVRG
jgi:Ca2+-binding EF-hand superfamily protein